MHILFLSPYPPYPPRSGGALRIYNLLRGLSQRHHVCCLTFAPDEADVAALQPLREFCQVITVQGHVPRSLLGRAWTTLSSPLPDMALRNVSPAYATALRQLLIEQRFDILQVESIEMAHYGLAVRHYQAQLQPQVPMLIFDEFNAEYVLQQRAALTDLRHPRTLKTLVAGSYSLIQWRKLAHYERRLLRTYDCTLAVSHEDRRALLRLDNQAAIAIVPNGVDTRYFARSAVPPDTQSTLAALPHTIVFTGSLDFRPNIDAVRWFIQAVLPRVRASCPQAHFVVVGRSPVPAVHALHDGHTVTVVGEVADVRPFISNAAVYVVPMRIGGGVRLKLLEALAMEAPVVCTSMGAEGVDELRDGDHLLLADTPDAFATAVIRLLQDRPAGDRLGVQGRKLVHNQYDWHMIVPRLEAAYARKNRL